MKDWQKTLLGSQTRIRQVIETIDRGDCHIALVVDEKQRLLGTVTDGDVRRGLLKGIGLDHVVTRVMQKKPVTAPLGEKRSELEKIMEQKLIRQIPLLDSKGRVAGLELLDDLHRLKVRENWVVLMAGGLGTRLRPLTQDCPKPLLKVGEKPILETILENFIEHGFRNFYLSVNYQDKMIRDHFKDGSAWGIRIHYLHENTKLGTAGALSLLPSSPPEPVLVMNGDLLTKVNFRQLLDFHREQNAAGTMCIREYDFQVPYGVVSTQKNMVRSIDEKPVHRFFVNAGIYVLEPQALKFLKKKKHTDMPAFLEKLMAKKMKISAFPIREYWIDIGRMDDLERANGEFASVFR